MSAREQARIKAIKASRKDADKGLPMCPEKYGAVPGSQWAAWYETEYRARITTHKIAHNRA